ncbi:BrxA family protein [uncultured Leuconostoc sp.]|uniref:BrxA family protein n=1 Tax=uncultured Leuconostoc sp. TaxID=173262 RepID=UPI00259A7581|nr:BrxA family protein [uncultured Leuconostoc sp.]
MKKKYLAGQVSQSFWQKEFGIGVSLFLAGKSPTEMREMSLNENIYLQASKGSRIRVAQAMNQRLSVIPDSLLDLYNDVDSQNQKLINLTAIMKLNQLLEDFIIEDFRNEIMLGDSKIEDYEWKAFMRRKEGESDIVDNWTDETKRRMLVLLKTFVRSSGLSVFDEQGVDIIQRHLLDPRVLNELEKENLGIYITAFTGV